MKRYLLIVAGLLMSLLYSCGKSSTPTPDNGNNGNGNNNGNGGNGNTNSYVVKSIGVSRILVGVDENFKLTVATIYGGGNKIILKAGTGNTIEIVRGGIATCPDAVVARPDGLMTYADKAIDNGNPPDTLSSAVIKLKGFDKSKTGYNQLNLVMSKYLWPSYVTGGYYNNVTFLKFQEANGKKNADYANILSTVFSGNVNVLSVEVAPPLSANPYVTEDQIVSTGFAAYDVKLSKVYNTQLNTLLFNYLNSYQLGTPTSPYATGLKAEWVNANDGTIANVGQYGVTLKFNNIKTGGFDQVVEPADTTSKVFLRVTGFDKTQFGFNQLRLFVANDGFYKGNLEISYNTNGQAFTPTFAFAKDVYKTTGLYCLYASPQWPHY